MLYIIDDQVVVNVCKDSRMYNNAMAMCSDTAKQNWCIREHDNNMNSMLTAGGQFLRRYGSLMAAIEEQQ
jgi:hypothetical protein